MTRRRAMCAARRSTLLAHCRLRVLCCWYTQDACRCRGAAGWMDGVAVASCVVGRDAAVAAANRNDLRVCSCLQLTACGACCCPSELGSRGGGGNPPAPLAVRCCLGLPLTWASANGDAGGGRPWRSTVWFAGSGPLSRQTVHVVMSCVVNGRNGVSFISLAPTYRSV